MKILKSKDFYASAFFIAMGQPMVDCQRQKGYTEFSFEETEQLRKLIKEFYSLKAAIEPNEYAQSIRALKGIIHSLSSTSDQKGSISNELKQKGIK